MLRIRSGDVRRDLDTDVGRQERGRRFAARGYGRKLTDPRWQRKRLEVLSRDDFTCVSCGEKTTELHVHHSFYRSGHEPWDYPQESLSTLCKRCHRYAERARRRLIELLSRCDPWVFPRIAGYVIGVSAGPGAPLMDVVDDGEEVAGLSDALRCDWKQAEKLGARGEGVAEGQATK